MAGRRRPYIGGSQHDSIVELALGYNGLGRLTGNETGGLGNMNFDVGWGRLFGHNMGTEIAWLLPAAVICLGAGLLLTRRAPRTDLTRAAADPWGGWLVVTAAVFSFTNGIVHPYYTVALAPAIGACIGIGATLLWRNRSSMPCATALAGAVARHRRYWPCVLLARRARLAAVAAAAVAVGGVGRSGAAVWWSGRLRATVADCRRSGDRGCLGGPDRVHGRDGGDTAPRGHPVGRARHAAGAVPSWVRAACSTAPTPSPALTAMLAAGADDYTWAAAASDRTTPRVISWAAVRR